MDIPTIATSRLNLRPFTSQDAEALHRILAQEQILRYFPNPHPPSLDRVHKIIAGQLNHWKEHGLGWWAVEQRATQELIGWNGLQYLPETDEVEIGYLLSRTHWRKGLATEGAQAGLSFGFECLGLKSIVGIVHPENTSSQRVLDRLGMSFTYEAEYFGMKVYRYVIDASSFSRRLSSGPAISAEAESRGTTGWDDCHPGLTRGRRDSDQRRL